MYTSTNAFEAGSHEVIYEPKIKKPSTFTTPLQIEIQSNLLGRYRHAEKTEKAR